MYFAPIAAFLSACLLTYVLPHRLGWLIPLDQPNERSLHVVPVSRAGGLAILGGISIGVSVLIAFVGAYEATLGWVALALAPIAVISFIDDRIRVSPLVRLLVQIVGALVVVGTDLTLTG